MELFLDIVLVTLIVCGIWKAIALAREQYLKRHGKATSPQPSKAKVINYPTSPSSTEPIVPTADTKEYEDAWSREEVEWYYLQHEKEQEELDEEEVMMYHHALYDDDDR